jgi:P4 family phage/plasmid primase-like protien
MTLAEQAQKYTNAGWFIFPLSPGTKIPPRGSGGFHDASSDSEQARQWWNETPNANIGLATGIPSNVFVVDLDLDEDKGKDGPRVWATLEREHGKAPETRTVQTPRGGRHLYFTMPDAHPIHSGTDKLGLGIDIRGDGGYVVAPPSIVGGNPYKIINATDPVTPPPWLVEKLRSKPSKAVMDDANLKTPAEAAKIIDALKFIQPSNYDEWIKVGMALHQWNGLSGLNVWDQWSQKCPDKYNRSAIESKWRSFDTGNGNGTVTLGSVFHIAEQNGWKPATATDADKLTEWDYANKLEAELPPIKTCGSQWFAYSNGAWQEIERATLRPKAQEVLPPIIRTARRESAVLEHLEGRYQVPAESLGGFYKFADGDIIINANNGVVKVSQANSVSFEPHNPDHLFTKKLAANFISDAQAPLFTRVLGEALADEHDRVLLQLGTGNFLLPDSRFETALVAYGEAGRGKSTVAETIAEVFGKGLVKRLTLAQLCDPRSYHVPQLRYAAVNLSTELDAVELDDSATFKAIISGEAVEARPIYGAPFTMTTSCKLLFLANTLPRFKRGTEAELRRTRFLRFDCLPAIKDVTLKAKLAQERDGVFRWMLDGLVELLKLPAMPHGGRQSREVHAKFRVSNDPIGTFVSTCCRLDASASVAKDTLRNAFRAFLEQHDLPLKLESWLLRTLYERWPQLKEIRPRDGDGSRSRVILGVGLNL